MGLERFIAVPYIFNIKKHSLKAYTLINLGASGARFIDFRFIRIYNFSLTTLYKPRLLYRFNR